MDLEIRCPHSGNSIRTSVIYSTASYTGESRYLSEFEEKKYLGSGGYGYVVLCENKLDKKQYAMKKVPLKATTLPYDKVLREVLALSSMDHQHIVRYFQAWVEPFLAETLTTSRKDFKEWVKDDIECELDMTSILESPTLYIQMGHCPRTLGDFLDQFTGKNFNVETAWKLFRQIVSGLLHIHSRGFLYLDLSVNNIFLDADGNCRIGDFGLAKALDAFNTVDRTGSNGTELYRAPERSSTEEKVKIDGKADIYSLGIIIGGAFEPSQSKGKGYHLDGFKEGSRKARRRGYRITKSIEELSKISVEALS